MIKAKFIGEDGSMGLVNGKTYDIDILTRSDVDFIYLGWFDGRTSYSRTWCPYSSIESIYANWQMRERNEK